MLRLDDYGNDDWPAQPPLSALVNGVHHADLFTLCAAMPDASVDMIAADLPYQITSIKWDVVIPFDPMWKAFKRVIKPRGAIVLTASQPFTSALVMSNPNMFKYSWVWDKVHATGHLNTNIMPMKQHEDVLIFGHVTPDYFPVMTPRTEKRVDKARSKVYGLGESAYGKRYALAAEYDEYSPKTILSFSNSNQADKVHPTQKPVDLFRYLIRTYTQPGELVFDPVVGSGTTAVAAREEGRRFVVGDSSAEYVQVARNRLAVPHTPSFMPMLEAAS